jgi:hypothetical protein
MMFHKIGIIFLVLPCVLIWMGCSETKPDGFPKIYPVELLVTQEGQPLIDADISLFPVDDSMTWSVGGRSDQNGRVVLRTHGRYVGAPLGKFKVVLFKEIDEGKQEYLDALNRHDSAAAAKINVKIFSCVKPEYQSQATTPIEIDITKNSKVIDVDAGSAVKLQQEFLR